jgi:hypothetical protein
VSERARDGGKEKFFPLLNAMLRKHFNTQKSGEVN